MLTEVVCVILSIIVLCTAMVRHPMQGRCPLRWYANGIRSDGHYECRPTPGGNQENDGTFGHPDITPDDPRVLYGRIYCSGGALPIQVNDRVVGCQRW